MATYSNQHWLLAHIRNSFISTDETGMCETVMASDDMPKHFLKKFQSQPNQTTAQQQRRSLGMSGQQANKDVALQEVDFVCYPGLDLSDDEDLDMTTQSFDIQMYPEVGAHRFRSNTAQKLEKMDIARRKAARTKNVNVDDIIVPPERSDFFVRKPVGALQKPPEDIANENVNSENMEKTQNNVNKEIKSKLSEQLANSPNQVQNKFTEFARFDGTSQFGIQTKRINVFLNMLPERERNYPIKICVISNAKIIEVIGLVCYKATIQFPDLPLKSIRHYALYMTEDNDDMEDFPPLDNREPCSKFGFSHLTLAERRPLAPVTRLDYDNNKSMTSEEEKSRLAAEALRSLQNIELNSGGSQADNQNSASQLSSDDHMNAYEKRMLSHNDILEAPMYRTYRLNFIDKRFFRTEVTLGISGDLLEIDQPKNAKFWIKQRQVSYAIDSVAFCEIVERRNLKSTLRIWLKAASSLSSGVSMSCAGSGGGDKNSSTMSIGSAHSPSGPSGYYSAHHTSSPFAFLSGGGGGSSSNNTPSGNTQQQIRFKHYDFETDIQTAEQILNKLNCILESRSSDVRTEFKQMRERKLGKSQAKKHLKL